jgi:hypothetical protein
MYQDLTQKIDAFLRLLEPKREWLMYQLSHFKKSDVWKRRFKAAFLN